MEGERPGAEPAVRSRRRMATLSVIGLAIAAVGLVTLAWMISTAYSCIGDAYYRCWSDGTSVRGIIAGYGGFLLFVAGVIVFWAGWWQKPPPVER
jgi:protein-S-isoprenylcysteine O-methyltransferase Ste14